MIILLSQLFPPATLLASALLAPEGAASSQSVRVRPARLPAGHVSNSLLDTVFGLRPTPEERPYAL
jgi:hypothetical protein